MRRTTNYNFLPISYINQLEVKERKKTIILIIVTILFIISTIMNFIYKKDNICKMYKQKLKIKSIINKQKFSYENQNKLNIIMNLISEYTKQKICFNMINIDDNYMNIKGVGSIKEYKILLNDLEKKRKFKITDLKYPNKNNNYVYEVEVYINRK